MNHPDDSYTKGTVPWETPEETECHVCNSSMTENIHGVIECDNLDCLSNHEDGEMNE